MLGSNIGSGWYPDGNGDYHLIWINGKSFFTIHCDDGWLSVSFVVTNGQGSVLLAVDKGELRVATAAWDYVYEGANIKVRGGPGEILLDMNFSDSKVEVIKGMFLDRTIDGFVVQDDVLLTKCEGKVLGYDVACSTANGVGGWGLINNNAFPDVIKPKGFGLFRDY